MKEANPGPDRSFDDIVGQDRVIIAPRYRRGEVVG
jgi:hypothetical protein